MEESSGQVVKRVLPICSLLLISGWFLSTFLPRGDSWGLFGILLGITLCCFWRKAPIKFSIIDAGVIIIWLYDLASLLWSINSSPTIISLYLGTTAAACYFLVRHISQTEKYFRWLLGFFCSIIGIVVAIGLGTFWFYVKTLKEIDIENIYFFRHLYRPFGLASNDWAGLLWLFGGIIAVAYTVFNSKRIQRWLFVLGGCILFLIVVSFSRGMYITLGIFIISAVVFFFRRLSIQYFRTFGLFTLFLIIATVLFHTPVCSTLQMGKTVSQQRSTSGRIEMSGAACTVIKEYPATGVGQGNFTLALNPSYFEDDRVGFTSYAPNLLVQITVEKGFIGLVLYLCWGFCILFYCIRNSRMTSWIVFGFLLLFVVREQTFPIFFESDSAQCLVFVLLATMQSMVEQKKKISSLDKRYAFAFSILMLITCFGTTCFMRRTVHNNLRFRACERALDNKNWTDAQYELTSCSQSIPVIINSILVYTEIYKHTQNDDLLLRMDSLLRVVIARNPKDNYPLYLRAKHPMLSANYSEGERRLRELITKYPNNAIYRYGFFKCLYRQNKTNEAAEQLSQCIVLSPQIMNTEYWRTLALQDSILFRETKRHLQVILQHATSEPLSLACLGKIAFELGDYHLAEEYLSESLRQLPNLSGAWYNIGLLYRERGLDKKANTCFRRAYHLERGAFAPIDRLEDYLQTRMVFRTTPETLLGKHYATKFQSWYFAPLLFDGIN